MSVGKWWMIWGDLATRLLAISSSFASLVGLLVAFLPDPRRWEWWVILLLFVAILGFIASVCLEVAGRLRRHVFAKDDTAGIKRYMHSWITHGSRVAVWTRDMSWARNTETEKLLREKARRNELVLCLPERNELTEQLEKDGAEVCAYGSALLESPAARFTIVFFGRDGSQVAVGRALGDAHVIDEFKSGEHPAFHLAADLISLARGLRQERRG